MADPVNDLAQLWIWRLEIKVLGIIGAVLVVAAVLIAGAFGGEQAMVWAYGSCMVGLILTVVFCVVYAIYAMLTGAGADAAWDEMKREQAAIEAKYGKDWYKKLDGN